MHFSCGIVRPPYEAGSCFLQVTSGCSHNKCRFCTFYKEAPFSVSPESEIREDLQEIRDSGWKVKRIFLQGADPFLLSYDRLKRIMDLIKEYLPWGVSVGGYGRVDSVRNKSVEQIRSLKEMGYDMIVFGIESGDDAVLDKMNKGYHASDIVEQLSKMDEAGMHYSVIFLYGLGGHDYGMGHAVKTAEVLNRLSPVRVLVSGGELTAEVFANYLRHKCLSDCTFLSKNARCQQTAGTLSEEDAAPLQRDNNKSQATRFLAA